MHEMFAAKPCISSAWVIGKQRLFPSRAFRLVTRVKSCSNQRPIGIEDHICGRSLTHLLCQLAIARISQKNITQSRSRDSRSEVKWLRRNFVKAPTQHK